VVPVPIYSFRIRRSCVISWSNNPCTIGIRQSTCRHHMGPTGLESSYIISWPPQQLLGIATAAQHVPPSPAHQTKYHKNKEIYSTRACWCSGMQCSKQPCRYSIPSDRDHFLNRNPEPPPLGPMKPIYPHRLCESCGRVLGSRDYP